jgi:hypothetical protein
MLSRQRLVADRQCCTVPDEILRLGAFISVYIAKNIMGEKNENN